MLTVLFVGVLAVAATLVDQLNAPNPLTGPFRVVDGDTLAQGRERLRLVGIDAPELDQTCRDGNEREWRCGEHAREQLRSLVREVGVQCRGAKKDRYQRLLVTCDVNGVSINATMVSSGLAVSSGRAYLSEEAEARRAKLGIWKGAFEAPREWRRRTAQQQEDDEPGSALGRLWERIW